MDRCALKEPGRPTGVRQFPNDLAILEYSGRATNKTPSGFFKDRPYITHPVLGELAMLLPHFLRIPVSVSVALLCLLTANVTPAQQVLRWKFQPGQQLHYHLEQLIKQELTPANSAAMQFTTTQTMKMRWEVKTINEDGTATVEQTVESFQAKMESAQGTMFEYDSTAGEEPEGLAKMLVPMLEALLNRPMVVRLTPRGETKEMKLPNGFLQKVNQLAGGGQFGQLFSEDWMKQFGNVSILPEGPVTTGQTWQNETEISNAIVGQMKVVTTSRYEGPVEREGRTFDRISTAIQFVPEKKEQPGIVGIREQSGEGTLEFDAEAGRLQQSESRTTMKMNIDILGQKMLQDLQMDMVMRLAPVEEVPSSSTESEQP
jgi:hypothetical protein